MFNTFVSTNRGARREIGPIGDGRGRQQAPVTPSTVARFQSSFLNVKTKYAELS
jgi:hypothetical protein